MNLWALLLDDRLAAGGERAVRAPGLAWTLSDLAERTGAHGDLAASDAVAACLLERHGCIDVWG